MYLITSKNMLGHERRAIAATFEAATQTARRMRLSNSEGIVVIDRPSGVTIFVDDESAELATEDTVCMQLSRAGWAEEATGCATP